MKINKIKNKQIRILLITRDYPPRIGGIGKVTINLENNIKLLGHYIKLLNFDGSSVNIYNKLKLKDFFYTRATLNFYFNIFNILNPFKFFKPQGFRDFVYNNLIYRESKEAIMKFKPDIIYLSKVELFTAIYKCKIPFIVTFHSEEDVNNFKKFMCYMPNGPKLMTSVSKHQIQNLQEKHKKKTAIILNGVNSRIFKPLKNTKQKRNVVLFAGRFIGWKGIKEIIHIAKQLPKYEFWFAGQGPLANEIKGKNIKNLGFKTTEELVKLYNQTTICIFPSWNEPFGLVGLEAMSCGKAVIATPLGFSEYIKNGKEGIIIPAKNESALKNAIVDLMINEKKRKILEKNARKKALKYSWNKIAKQYLKVFEEVIKENEKTKINTKR